MLWRWKACIGVLFFVTLVALISQAIEMWSLLTRFKSYMPSTCHIMGSWMGEGDNNSAHYCCEATSSSCGVSSPNNIMPSCSALLALYTRLTPQGCTSNTSAACPAEGSRCDGGHSCCGGFPFHGCYDHSLSFIYCHVCYTVWLNISYGDGQGKVMLRRDFRRMSSASMYLERYPTNASVRCMARQQSGGVDDEEGDAVVLNMSWEKYAPLRITFLTISAFLTLLETLVFIRYVCIQAPSTKVCPHDCDHPVVLMFAI